MVPLRKCANATRVAQPTLAEPCRHSHCCPPGGCSLGSQSMGKLAGGCSKGRQHLKTMDETKRPIAVMAQHCRSSAKTPAKTNFNRKGKRIFASPLGTVPARDPLQQRRQTCKAACLRGERRCKIASPLSWKASAGAPRGQPPCLRASARNGRRRHRPPSPPPWPQRTRARGCHGARPAARRSEPELGHGLRRARIWRRAGLRLRQRGGGGREGAEVAGAP